MAELGVRCDIAFAFRRSQLSLSFTSAWRSERTTSVSDRGLCDPDLERDSGPPLEQPESSTALAKTRIIVLDLIVGIEPPLLTVQVTRPRFVHRFDRNANLSNANLREQSAA